MPRAIEWVPLERGSLLSWPSLSALSPVRCAVSVTVDLRGPIDRGSGTVRGTLGGTRVSLAVSEKRPRKPSVDHAGDRATTCRVEGECNVCADVGCRASDAFANLQRDTTNRSGRSSGMGAHAGRGAVERFGPALRDWFPDGTNERVRTRATVGHRRPNGVHPRLRRCLRGVHQAHRNCRGQQ